VLREKIKGIYLPEDMTAQRRNVMDVLHQGFVVQPSDIIKNLLHRGHCDDVQLLITAGADTRHESEYCMSVSEKLGWIESQHQFLKFRMLNKIYSEDMMEEKSCPSSELQHSFQLNVQLAAEKQKEYGLNDLVYQFCQWRNCMKVVSDEQ
jgi:hypothetical protein